MIIDTHILRGELRRGHTAIHCSYCRRMMGAAVGATKHYAHELRTVCEGCRHRLENRPFEAGLRPEDWAAKVESLERRNAELIENMEALRELRIRELEEGRGPVTTPLERKIRDLILGDEDDEH